MRALFSRFVKFCFVGLSGTIIDLGFLALLVEIFHINVYLANGCSFSLAVVNNYLWNKYWTFKGRDSGNFWRFFFVSLAGLLLNTILLKVFLGLGIWYIFAKLMITVIVVAWNFLGNNYWTFKPLYK